VLLAGCGEDEEPTSGGGSAASSEGPVKVGLTNALSGGLSITEKSIHQGSLLAVDQINAAGGIAGRQIEAITEDYASDFTIAVQKAEKLIRDDKVAIVVGGYTSASRVAMIPTFQKNDALLFYGTYYEGLECDNNTFYGGAVPNQLLVNYVPWIMQNLGKSFYIVGSDYIYPRTVSAIVQKLVKDGGGTVVSDRYFELGTTEFGSVVSDIRAKKPDVVFSNMVGDSTPAFYKQYRSAGLTAEKNPIAATVTTEVEVQAMGAENAEGHYMTSSYFQSLDNPANKKYVADFKEKFGADAVTHMPQVGTYNSVWLFAKGFERANGDTSTDALMKGIVGATFDDSPEGQPAVVSSNHHANHPSYVGQTNAKGQYDVIETFEPREADPFPEEVVPADRRPECPTPFEA
jgi:ABC-type branched-subunit amino acid transport system substrate-binding protein